MSYTSPPKTFTAGAILTASDLNTYLRDAIENLFPVGAYLPICAAATSVETLINGVWLECNGTAVSRSTYASLNTLLSGLSYPFGSGDGSTTFNLPDFRGRDYTVHSTASGNAATKTMGLSDGLTLANRTPKGTVTAAGTTGTEASHTHNVSWSVVAAAASGTGTNVPSVTSVTSGSGSSHSHSFSGSGTVPGNYLVAGIIAIKAFL